MQVSEGKNLLDAKVAAAFSKILHGALAKQIQLLEEKAEAEKRLLKGRQIAWYIKDYFRINADHGAVMDFSDLITVKMQGSYVKEYLHDWASVLLAINKTPDAVILELLFFGQLEKSRLFEEFVRTLQARRNAERKTERLRTPLANGATSPRRTPPQEKPG